MDPVRLGGDVRLLRRQRGWTQARLAAEARVSRARIVRIEGGHAAASDIGDIAAVVAALGGYLSVRVLFHGEGLDRLRDRRHAALVDRVIRMLVAAGWLIEPEVSFNVDGERGAVDILAFHPATGALLVIEVKTVVPDVGGMLATLDRKTRLAADIAHGRGWEASTVSRVLVVLDSSTDDASTSMRPPSTRPCPAGPWQCAGGSARRTAPSLDSCSCQKSTGGTDDDPRTGERSWKE